MLDFNSTIKKLLTRSDIRQSLSDKNFDYIYNFLALQQNPDLVSRVSEVFLYKLDINPLNYLTHTPEYFLYDSDLVKSFEVPDTVLNIRAFSFYGCKYLTNIQLPSHIKVIGDEAFSGCESLQSIVIPDTIETIGSRAFSECTNLKNITIGSSIKKVRSYCFGGCPNLEVITFNGTKKDFKKVFASIKLWISKPVTIKCVDDTFVEEVTKG